jgi:alpha-L-rhamnosidase
LVGIGVIALAFTLIRGAISPTELTCESRRAPLGVDVPAPRLGWADAESGRAHRQTAYEIEVGSSRDLLERDGGDLWRSGHVLGSDTSQIRYAGRALKSSQEVFWRVRVWDEKGGASDWSPAATWTMGVVGRGYWRAQWIGYPGTPAPETLLLRREFHIRVGLVRAIVHVCGLGQYEMTLNGRKVGKDLLSPGWTNYRKTCLYDTYDVTGFLRAGVNAAGLFLGNGMYREEGKRYAKFVGSFGPQQAIAQIDLEFADGTTEHVRTDTDWTAHAGPITLSSVYGGEDFDARQVESGWDRTGFTGLGWVKTRNLGGPGGELRGLSCSAAPIRPHETIQPVARKAIRPGIAVYDLGQNASYMIRLTVFGPAGSAVRVIPAELVHPDGTVDRSSCGGGLAWWQYTLAGIGREIYFPKFSIRAAAICRSNQWAGRAANCLGLRAWRASLFTGMLLPLANLSARILCSTASIR